jgi:hypothetical protein
MECVDVEEKIVIAIEVKDKTLTVSDVEERLSVTRRNGN